MDIQAEINWIHQEIIDSNTVYNIDINNALEDISKGNVYSEDQAREIAKKWGRK
ncbi:hypothetical protein EV144_1011027 [Flavobacterium sp. 270]|uniref:hypothetical protein n=1 Tax=Flavobacterium sp. 270 TaxID=2512114 RepID=UPI0010D56D26|nr:hypothetical protein [Flavobacterium sp. 270]TDW52338.1 hypothetical protein EV144_1011027 [Flavobacterium sp. 270]